METPTLFSYVVSHDHGTAPHPGNGNCVLSHCKFSKTPGRKNLVESVQVGDWIVGTGGSGDYTAPSDRLVYAMKVEKKLPIKELFSDTRFTRKSPGFWHKTTKGPAYGESFVVSFKEFYYFGKKAPKIPVQFLNFPSTKGGPAQSLKAGRNYKKNFSEDFIRKFVAWIQTKHKGKRGEPWFPLHQGAKSKCPPIRCWPEKRLGVRPPK
jgi:hypothetical protein